MPDTLIENPILNSPYGEPTRHFRFGDEGITNEIVETRRASAYFVPIPPPKKKGKQLQFETQWTQDRIEPNNNVNRVRERVTYQSLGFSIPYTVNGVERQYYADFLVRLDDGRGKDDPLNLIVEVTGEQDKDKEAKTATARTLWVPAVNNHGGFGRWVFVEVTDPYDDVVKLIRAATTQHAAAAE